MPLEPPHRKKFTLQEVVQHSKEFALQQGGHIPALVVEGSQDSLVTYLPDAPTHPERLELLYRTGYLMGSSGQIGLLEQVFFISQAWMSEDNIEHPAKDPQRIEVLIVTALAAKSGVVTMALCELLRNQKGKLTDLRDMEPPNEDEDTVESPLLAAFAEGFRAALAEAKEQRELLFPLGQVVATPGALHALEEAKQDSSEFISRHHRGDWGELDEEDKQANDRSVKQGSRILSAYRLSTNVKIWIITEWDRSVTTVLLPSEY